MTGKLQKVIQLLAAIYRL